MPCLPQRLAALRERNYRLFFTGQTLSTLGDFMAPVAITFAILDRGGTASQVGWVLGAGTATMVLLLLFGGTVADRWPRRRVMLVADVARCAVQAAAAALLVAGHWHLWELLVLEGLWGAGAAFFNPAMTGLLPQLLTGEVLAQGNALQGLSWSLGAVAGPALAGVLVATAGAGSAVALDAGTFLVSAAMLSRLALPPSAERTTATSMLADLVQGWQAFRSRTWLWVIVAEFSVWNLLVYAPETVLGAVVAKAHLGGAGAWGAISSAEGLGAIGGGLVALHFRPRRPLVAATLATAGFIPVPVLFAVTAPVALIAVAAAIGGAGFALCATLWDTTLQQQVPAEVLSRVSAYDWLGTFGLLPAGYALAGPMAALIGVRGALFGAAAVMTLEVICVLAVPSVRKLTAPAPPGPS